MEYNFVESLPEDFSCQICMKVLSEPQLTDCCGQHFCRACLENWFKKQVEHKKVCPHCRSEDFNHMHSLYLKRKIDELKVYCSNRELGCVDILKLCELADHLSLQSVHGCDFTSVVCPNECGVSGIIRKDLQLHCQKFCPKRTVKCQYCQTQGSYDHITEVHVRDECGEVLLQCARRCLDGVGIKRKDLKKHKEVCPLEPVECPFFKVGCTEKVIRKDFDNHMEKSTNQHSFKALNSHRSLLLKIETATSEIRALQEVVKDKEVSAALEIISIRLKIPKHDLEMIKEGDVLTFTFPCGRYEWRSDFFYVMGCKMNFSLYKPVLPTWSRNGSIDLNVMLGELDIELEPVSLDIGVEVENKEPRFQVPVESEPKRSGILKSYNPVTDASQEFCHKSHPKSVLSLALPDGFFKVYTTCVVKVKLLAKHL